MYRGYFVPGFPLPGFWPTTKMKSNMKSAPAICQKKKKSLCKIIIFCLFIDGYTSQWKYI